MWFWTRFLAIFQARPFIDPNRLWNDRNRFLKKNAGISPISHYLGRSLHSNFITPKPTVQPCETSKSYKLLQPRIIWYQSIISGRWFGCDYLKYFTVEFMVFFTPSKCFNNFNEFNLVIICWLGTININKSWEDYQSSLQGA